MASKKTARMRELPKRFTKADLDDAYQEGLEDQADLEHKGIFGLVAGAVMGGSLGYAMATEPESMKKAFEAFAQSFKVSAVRAVPVGSTGPVASGADENVAPRGSTRSTDAAEKVGKTVKNRNSKGGRK